jgi:hypothetical protein
MSQTLVPTPAIERNRRPYATVLDTIGWTPLIRLNRVTRGVRTPVYGKAEFFNPGGSVKDRIGLPIIEQAERDGSLKPGGIYVSMDVGFGYHLLPLAVITKFVGSRRATLGVGRYRKEDLLLVKRLVEEGKYRPVIDRRYDLDEIVEAVRYVESGQKTGNVVLRVT